jgi:uncharacterized protein|tara:strand:- start:1367 stop:2011 length:645 start_codon:yes stop_codon:yes gene_type:complete
MMDDEFFDKLREKIQPYYEDGGSHDFSHTERVYNMAIKISEGEDVDMDIVRTAVLLHDTARHKQDCGEVDCHAVAGAQIAEEILKETDFPKDKIEKVVYAISVHRHSSKAETETREAEILQDADRLDALGAIIIGRMFATGGKMGTPLYDPKIPLGEMGKGGYSKTTINGFYDKLAKIKPETFKTAKARRIAKDRYKYIMDFAERFKKEWRGEI